MVRPTTTDEPRPTPPWQPDHLTKTVRQTGGGSGLRRPGSWALTVAPGVCLVDMLDELDQRSVDVVGQDLQAPGQVGRGHHIGVSGASLGEILGLGVQADD